VRPQPAGWSKRATSSAGAAAALLGAGCRPDPRTPRGTAESFLDAHYVRIDLAAALPFTSGLARHKVESEIGLTQGQVIDASTEHFVFEITGEQAKVEEFIALMQPLGLVEVARTGLAAISRGPERM